MKFFCIFGFLCIFLSGCSLIPSRVEYFQDKVEKVPEKTESHLEVQKEAADYLYNKTEETVQAAIKENASTNILKPAVESHLVANSLSDSLGKPEKPFKGEVQLLVDRLDRLEAKLDKKLEDFRRDNNQNAGKTIEGTGWSIGFFTQYFLIGIVLVVIWFAIKVLGMFNPAISIGSKLVSGGIFGIGKKAAELAEQTIQGGQEFKRRVEEQFEDPKTKQQILDLFHLSQKINQSPENQEIIKKLIN